MALDAIESSRPVNIAFGKVISASPIKIQIDEKLVLDEDFLILTRNVTDYSFEITVGHVTEKSKEKINTKHSHSYAGATSTVSTCEEIENHNHDYLGVTEEAGVELELTHSHGYSGKKSFLVHNGLKVGEKVILFRVQGGQKYVVLDRI